LYWAPLRRDLYRTRLERAAAVARLRVVEETQTLRFIALNAELRIAEIEDEAKAAAVLAAHGFPELDTGLLHRPEYTPCAELVRRVTAPGAGFAYLLGLKGFDLLRSAAAKRERALARQVAALKEAEAALAERPVPGASLWRADIAEFVKVAARGVATNWSFKG